MTDTIEIKNVSDLKAFIKKADAVFVTIMLGNMTWHSKITKREALAIAEDILDSWSDSVTDLDVSAYATYNMNDHSLTIGGS